MERGREADLYCVHVSILCMQIMTAAWLCCKHLMSQDARRRIYLKITLSVLETVFHYLKRVAVVTRR